jgi:hypothetical protein
MLWAPSGNLPNSFNAAFTQEMGLVLLVIQALPLMLSYLTTPVNDPCLRAIAAPDAHQPVTNDFRRCRRMPQRFRALSIGLRTSTGEALIVQRA